MGDWQKQYPPYRGTEPYLFFAFADGDAGRVWPVVRVLLKRGVRVWYCSGAAGSAEKLLERQERSDGAALTLLYLTDAAAEDKDTKSLVLVNQKRKHPILCLAPDGTDRRLAMGLREDVPHLLLRRGQSEAELEETLIRADGFTQEIFGEPVPVGKQRLLGRLSVVFTLLAAVLLALTFAGSRYLHWFQPTYKDRVVISDPVILAAARQAAGGGSLTEEALSSVTALCLTEMPESWEDLDLLPALERILIPQNDLLDGGPLPEGYVIELTGGLEK